MLASVHPFVAWFAANDGLFERDVIDIVDLPEEEGSRGVVALKDIPEGVPVISIPRALVLSTRTSALRERFGKGEWFARGLHEGWSGLILCMMWEEAQGSKSKWAPYFDVLPTTFDTPMFWSDADLAELQGTVVVDKLGREQAEKEYAEKVRPALESRPDLFDPADRETRYSLASFHLQGSRILSRSFTLQKGKDYDEDGPDAEVGNTSVGSAMDVDGDDAHDEDEDEHEGESDSEDEDEDDPGFVAMVPFADMLNARYQSENVKLFYEEDCLKMIATKPIKAGEQIWNTYQDLPNSELLRGFGHVDCLPLADGGVGNPGDVAELRADLLVKAVGGAKTDMEERIDWWLEEGGDDVFVLELGETEFPADLLAFTQLIADDAEWAKAKEKEKMPKPRAGPEALGVLHAALSARLGMYATTLGQDMELARGMEGMGRNKRNALVVRMGEKRVLEMFRAKAAGSGQKGKRKAEEGGGKDRKRQKEGR